MMGPFEQQVEAVVEAQQCALDQLYGGMPEAGNYKAYTEYEIGAQRIAEAAHCILGSAGKVHSAMQREKDHPYSPWSIEEGHFREEIGIIRKTLKEYSKPVYTDRAWFRTDYRFDSLKSMRENSPKLEARAVKYRRLLERDKEIYDPALYDIAWWAYTVIEELAQAVALSVKGDKDAPSPNAYANSRLALGASILNRKIDEAYRR